MAAVRNVPVAVFRAVPSDCAPDVLRAPAPFGGQAIHLSSPSRLRLHRQQTSHTAGGRWSAQPAASWVAFGSAVGTASLRGRRRRRVSAARAVVSTERAVASDVHSPFEGEGKDGSSQGSAAEGPEEGASPLEQGSAGKPKLSLTMENVETVVDDLRPYLKSDGGDAKIVGIDGTVVRLEFQGACSSCSASSVTLKMGIERTLKERIPEITEVIAVMPEQEQLTEEGLEEVLNGIRPFLKVSGGAISLQDLQTDGTDGPKVDLLMEGPPVKSMAVRLEIVNRIKRRFPAVQDINIGGDENANSEDVNANRGI